MAHFNIEKKCFGGGNLSASRPAVYICLQIYYLWAGGGGGRAGNGHILNKI